MSGIETKLAKFNPLRKVDIYLPCMEDLEDIFLENISFYGQIAINTKTGLPAIGKRYVQKPRVTNDGAIIMHTYVNYIFTFYFNDDQEGSEIICALVNGEEYPIEFHYETPEGEKVVVYRNISEFVKK